MCYALLPSRDLLKAGLNHRSLDANNDPQVVAHEAVDWKLLTVSSALTKSFVATEIQPSTRLRARDKEAADENPHIAATSALVSPG